jgi:hypothetical protein
LYPNSEPGSNTKLPAFDEPGYDIARAVRTAEYLHERRVDLNGRDGKGEAALDKLLASDSTTRKKIEPLVAYLRGVK